MSEKVIKPWGYYEVLFESNNYKVKRIVISPGCRISLQRHQHRTEHWIVVQGRVIVKVGNSLTVMLLESQSFKIKKNDWHRATNASSESELIFIEVQTGELLTEEDIERKEDDYGRV